MLRYIICCKFIQNESGKEKNESRFNVENESKYRKQVGKLLMMKNREKLTPLQLATKREQYKIFDIIINHEVSLRNLLELHNKPKCEACNKYVIPTRQNVLLLFSMFLGDLLFLCPEGWHG
jgi:hypothetical protein